VHNWPDYWGGSTLTNECVPKKTYNNFFRAFDINKRSTQLYRLQNYAQSIPLCMTGEVVQGLDFLPILAGKLDKQLEIESSLF